MHLFIRTAGIFAAVSALSFSLPVPNAAAARKIPPTTLSVQYGKVLERGVQKIELTAVYENKGLYATQATISVSDTKTDELLFRFLPNGTPVTARRLRLRTLRETERRKYSSGRTAAGAAVSVFITCFPS